MFVTFTFVFLVLTMKFTSFVFIFQIILFLLPLTTSSQQSDETEILKNINSYTYLYYENTNKNPAASLDYAEKAFSYYDHISSSDLRFTVASNYTTALFINERYQDALQILDKVEPLNLKENDKALYFTLKGLIKSELNHITEAESLYTTALEIYRKMGDSDNEFAILNNLGLLHNNIGDYKKSLEYYLSCYDIINNLKVKVDRFKYYMNIGTVNFNLNNYTQSLQSFTHALEDATVNLDSLRIFKAKEKLAQTNVNLNRLDMAKRHYNNALLGYKKLGLKREVSNILLSLGDIYHTVNNKSLEFENYNKALEIAIAHNFKQETYQASLKLGHYYQEQRSFSKAIQLYKRIVDNIGEIINLETIRAAYNGLYQIEKLNNNALKSLDYLEHYLHYDKLIKQKQTISQNDQIESKYKLRQKEFELEKLKANYQLNELELKNKNQKIEGLILFAVLIAILLIIILTSFFQKRKSERILALKNEKINRQNEKLLQTNSEIKASRKELTELNKLKSQLLSVIAHDVKSPITDLYNLLFILRNNMDLLSKQELIKNLAIIESSTSNILNLLNNILNWVISQSSGSKVKKSKFSLNEIIKNNINLVESSRIAKELKITFFENKQIDYIITDPDIVDFAIRNLLSNAVKFTKDNGTVNVRIRQTSKDMIAIRIEDSGVGFNEEIHTLLKQDEERVPSAVGTNTEKGYGIGLSLGKKMLAKIDSKITYEKNRPTGSVFILHLRYTTE